MATTIDLTGAELTALEVKIGFQSFPENKLKFLDNVSEKEALFEAEVVGAEIDLEAWGRKVTVIIGGKRTREALIEPLREAFGSFGFTVRVKPSCL